MRHHRRGAEAAGYQTLMSGKWHVTPVTQSKHNWPLQRGFDRYYGIIHGAADYFNPVTLTRDNELDRSPIAPNYYFTDAIADNAVEFIEARGGEAESVLPVHGIHFAALAAACAEADIERYKGRYKDGWDALREERRKRMIEMGIVDRAGR